MPIHGEIIAETANSYNDQLMQLPLIASNEFVFVLDYITKNDECYGIGLDRSMQHVRIRMNIKPFLPIWISHPKYTKAFVHLADFDLTRPVVYGRRDCRQNITSVSALDYLTNSDKNKTWYRVDVPMTSFKGTKKLYYALNSNQYPGNMEFVKTCANYTLEFLLMLRARQLRHPEDADLPNMAYKDVYLYNVWLNGDFVQDSTLETLKLDIVSLDIETVSHEDHRLPMGDNLTDILFSTSITYIPYRKDAQPCHLSLINLPVPQHDLDKAKHLIADERDYSAYPRIVELYNTERDLMQRICDFLDSLTTTFILLGYNSRGYDMMFIAKRMAFLNMPQVNRLFNQNGALVYGRHMIHVDLMVMVSKYFAGELGSFSLKNVATNVLEMDRKVDLNARLLRYIYYYIKENGLCGGIYEKWDVNLSKMMYYNDMDSILVYQIWEALQYAEFTMCVGKLYALPLAKMVNLGAHRVSEYLTNKLLRDALNNNTIFTRIAPKQVSYLKNGELKLQVDTNQLALTKDIGLGGGFNYRHSQNVYESCYSCDFKMYYPLNIAGFNLSHETTSFCTVGVFKKLISMNMLDMDKIKNVQIFHFCSHRRAKSHDVDDADLENNIESKMYINGQLSNGPLLSLDDLHELHDNEKIIVILSKQQKHGILAQILEKQNETRNRVRETTKLLESEKDDVEALIVTRKKEEQLKKMREAAKLAALQEKMARKGANNAQDGDEDSEDDDDDEEEEEDDEFIPDDDNEEESTPVVENNQKNDSDNEEDDEEEDEDDEFIPDDDNEEEGASDDNMLVKSDINNTSNDDEYDDDFKMIELSIQLLPTNVKNRLSPQELEKYLNSIKYEYVRLNSQYRNLKIVNSAIYGLLGSKSEYGLVKAIYIASVATFIGRKHIIETGVCAEDLGMTLTLVDTDSTFITISKHSIDADVNNGKVLTNQVINHVANINSCLILGAKLYKHLFVMAKKTYIAYYEKIFSRGINKNGPQLWFNVMYGLFEEFIMKRAPIKRADLLRILKKIYMDTYKLLRNQKELVLCQMNIKDINEYRSETPAKKLMSRISKINPEYVFGSKIDYFHVLLNKPQDSYFGIDYELSTTPIYKFNLYKFFSKINMAMYSILKQALIDKNKERGVYYILPLVEFNNENLAAFNQARIEFMDEYGSEEADAAIMDTTA